MSLFFLEKKARWVLQVDEYGRVDASITTLIFFACTIIYCLNLTILFARSVVLDLLNVVKLDIHVIRVLSNVLLHLVKLDATFEGNLNLFIPMRGIC